MGCPRRTRRSLHGLCKAPATAIRTELGAAPARLNAVAEGHYRWFRAAFDRRLGPAERLRLDAVREGGALCTAER